MHASLLTCSQLVSFILPIEWCCPQWAGPSYFNQQSDIDMTTGQPDLDDPSPRLLPGESTFITLIVKVKRHQRYRDG